MLRFASLFIALILVAVAAGCQVDQKKEVAQYEKVLDANVLNGQSAFLEGEPLTLRQALDLANRQNERLAIEGENYVQALADRQRAAAAFMPTVQLVPTWSLRERVSSGGSDSAQQNSFVDVPVNAN